MNIINPRGEKRTISRATNKIALHKETAAQVAVNSKYLQDGFKRIKMSEAKSWAKATSLRVG